MGGALVVGVLHRPPGGRAPCVVACHGMGASKDSDKYLLLAREFPAAGVALARFDFRGSGESGGLYRDSTVASRADDLGAVLAWLAGHPALDGRLGLLGSSLGGFVALCVAARGHAGTLPVVTWNAPAVLRDLEAAAAADPAGIPAALVAEVRAGQMAAAPAGVPHVLVIQGEADEVVPPRHGRALYARAAEPRALHLIPGADHRLTDPLHRMEAVRLSRQWLARHLGEPAP